MVSATMIAAAEDLDVNLDVLYAERDRFRMQALGKEVIARPTPPDYLVMVNEEQAAEEMVRLADQAGIKTFLMLNEFIGEQSKRMGAPRTRYPNWLGSIIPDNGNAGQRMAEAIFRDATRLLDPNADGKYHLLAIGGDKITPASIDRNEGLFRALKDHPNVRLDRMVFANWTSKTWTSPHLSATLSI